MSKEHGLQPEKCRSEMSRRSWQRPSLRSFGLLLSPHRDSMCRDAVQVRCIHAAQGCTLTAKPRCRFVRSAGAEGTKAKHRPGTSDNEQ